MSEFAKYGQSKEIDGSLVDGAREVSERCQATALEMQLARSFNKSKADEKHASILKYMSLYATTPEELVHPIFWQAAQSHLTTKKKVHKK